MIKYYQNLQRGNRYYKPKNSYNIDLVVSDFAKRGQKSFVGHGKIFRRLEISGVVVLSTRGSSKYFVPVLVAIRVLFELGYTRPKSEKLSSDIQVNEQPNKKFLLTSK